MRYFWLCVLCCISYNYNSLKAQDSTSANKNLLTIKGKLGKIDLSFEFDTLDQSAIRDALINLDSLNNNDDRFKTYGHNFFRIDTLGDSKSTSTEKVIDSYVLGEGDEISVSIFGISQYEAKFVIDEDGFVRPDNLPKILLKGSKWKDAQEILKRRFQNYFRFRSDQFSAAVVSPRSIIVNVFGEVTNPGSYEVPATYTAYSVLRRALGPTPIGSVRNIIITNGDETRILDLYQLFNNPKDQFEYYLKDNSIIQIPTAEKTVRIVGAVKRPLNYELLPNEGLTELIEYAGGLASSAITQNFQLKRYQNGRISIIDLDESHISSNYRLNDGDVIMIKGIDQSEMSDNFVRIEGAVVLPGTYSLSTTPNVSTLLKKALLRTESRTDIAYLIRTKPNGSVDLIKVEIDQLLTDPSKDITLQPKDNLRVNDLTNFLDKSTISIEGAVRQEIELPFDSETKIHLSQLVFLSGGLGPEANGNGYLLRSNQNNLKEQEYIKINLREAVKDEFGPSDISLQPWDKVIVLSASNFTEVTSISIGGAVREPVTILFDESLLLKDLIAFSGGLSDNASRKITIARLNTSQDSPTRTTSILLELDEKNNIIAGPDNFKLMPYDEVIVRYVSEFEFQKYVFIRGEVVNGGKYIIRSDGERISDIINRAGGLTTEAFASGTKLYRAEGNSNLIDSVSRFLVITDLQEVLTNSASSLNHILKNQDIIVIPKKSSVVYINISNTKAADLRVSRTDKEQIIGVQYVPGKSAKWYIEEFAGGFTKQADKSDVKVLYANGALKKSKGGLFKKYPIPEIGSTIYVGAKTLKSEVSDSQVIKSHLLKEGVIINIDSKESKVTGQLIDNDEEKANEQRK